MGVYNPAKRGSSRVFLIDGGARPDHVPEYMDCWIAGGENQSFGDIERIECPSPDAYNQWVEIGEIQGAEERPTTSLTGRLALDTASEMKRIAKKRCSVDVQYHFGECTDPRAFNDYKKVIIFETSYLTNYSSEDYGALMSGDQAAINESSDLSARLSYDVMPLSVARRGEDVTLNPVVDVVICDTISCGECEDESDGCQKVYAVDNGTTGSPGTAPDLLYSTDKAVTIAAEDINSLTSAEPADALACVDEYVVVVSNASGSLHYKEKEDIGVVAGGWTEEATGFEVGGEPNDIWSVGPYAFIVGDGGYVYGCENPADGVEVLDAGIATAENLNAVHAISETFAVAVGAANVVVYTENGTIWTHTNGPDPAPAALLCVWVVDERHWWVGTDAGDLFYTLDAGATWTEQNLPGVAWADIHDIAFATKSVGFLVGDKTTTKGYWLKTLDGGQSWIHLPEAGTIIGNDSLVAVAACKQDVNFAVAVGTDDNAADGIMLVAS
jgi:photosystem II stability/assembly factor-like uncharacterized protein